MDTLTTEYIRKKFKNNFNLCNFSIHMARNMLLSGTQATLSEILEIVEDHSEEAKERA